MNTNKARSHRYRVHRHIYWSLYKAIAHLHSTKKDAWIAAEDAFEAQYGFNMYNSYESFRQGVRKYGDKVPTLQAYHSDADKTYYQIYFEQCAQTTTYEDAWQATERIYRRLTGHNLYKSYKSFKNAKSRHILMKKG